MQTDQVSCSTGCSYGRPSRAATGALVRGRYTVDGKYLSHRSDRRVAYAEVLADLAVKHRLPMIGSGEFAQAGALMGFGANLLELYRRVGFFVDKIIKGTQPGIIPVEQPARFEFLVNMKTARLLDIKMPQLFLQRADRLIE